jgi:anti-sigma factor RsiW
MTRPTPIEETELHAFIDGELPPDRAAAVQAALAAEPSLAARVAAYRADQLRLQALLGPVADRPLPPSWRARIQSYRAPGRISGPRMAVAAALALALLGGTATLLQQRHGQDTILAEAQGARDGTLLPTETITGAVLAKPGTDLWLQAALSLNVRPPDLTKFGYRLVTMDVYRGPAAGLVYRNAQAAVLTIYVRKSAGDARFDLLRHGKLRVCIWQDDVVSAVMTADMSAGEMMRVASAAYSSLDM